MRRPGFWTTALAAVVLLGQVSCESVAPKLPTKLSVVSAPSATPKNRVAFPAQPAVQLQDADGGAVAKAGTNVTASITGGGGTLAGTATVATDANGKATFTDLMLTGSASEKVLTFSADGLTSATATVTLTAGSPTTMAMSAGASQTATAGAAVATAPAVKITDADANVVSGTTVTFAVASGGGSVAGGSATSDATGIARVTSWTLGTTVGTNTLTATAAGLTGSPVTFTATGTVGAPAALAKTAGDNQTATTTSGVTTAPAVKLSDANGNAVAGATVTFAVATGGGSLTGGSQTTNSAGIATVGSWTLGPAAGTNTLTASSTGVTSVTFNATATAPPPTVVAFCSVNKLPLWFAYQNGPSGAWTALTVPVDGRINVPITSVGAIAWVFQFGTAYEQNVIFLTRAELAQIGCLADGANGTKTISGSVSGVTANEYSEIGFGGSNAHVPGGTTSFSLGSAPDDARDLIAGGRAASSQSTLYQPARYIVRRGLNPANGSSLPVLDFASSEAAAPTTATYTLNGVGTDAWFANTDMRTANLTVTQLGYASGTGTGGAVAAPYQVLPASLRAGTDEYRFLAFASGVDFDRGVNQNLLSFGNRSVTLGPLLSVPTITNAASSPNIRMRYQLASQTAYSAYTSAFFWQRSQTVQRDAYVFTTAGYLGGAPATWDVTMPDLSAAGFQTVWGLQPGLAVSFHVDAGSFLGFSVTDETPSLFASRYHDYFVEPARGAAPVAAHGRPTKGRLPWRRK
jgi:hypothetical protein